MCFGYKYRTPQHVEYAQMTIYRALYQAIRKTHTSLLDASTYYVVLSVEAFMATITFLFADWLRVVHAALAFNQ